MTRIPAITHLAAVALIATGSAFAQDHGVKADRSVQLLRQWRFAAGWELLDYFRFLQCQRA